MATINQTIQDDLKTLYTRYQALAWYKKWFFPSSVKNLLASYSDEQRQNPHYVSSLYQALFHQTSNWQRWIFSCLNAWFKADINTALLSSKLATNDNHGTLNCEAVIQHEMPTEFIPILRQYHFLTKSYHGSFIREALAKHKAPELLGEGFKSLKYSELLTNDKQGLANCQALENHENPEALADGLYTLDTYGLLTDDEQGQANRLALQEHHNPQAFVRELCKLKRDQLRQERDMKLATFEQEKRDKALKTLKKANLLNENTHNALANANNPQWLANALCTLKDNGLLNNDDQINAVLTISQYPNLVMPLTDVLCQLKRFNLLNDDTQGQANYDTLLHHKKPLSFAEGLLCLKWHGLLNSDEQITIYRETLNNYHNPLTLAKALCRLAALGLLYNDEQGQTNREAICQNNYLELISAYLTSLHKGTNHQHNFDQLITHQGVLGNTAISEAFLNIPERLRTQELFDGLFDLANQNKLIEDLGRDAIETYLNTFNPKVSENIVPVIHRESFFQIASTSSSSSTAQAQPYFASASFNK